MRVRRRRSIFAFSLSLDLSLLSFPLRLSPSQRSLSPIGLGPTRTLKGLVVVVAGCDARAGYDTRSEWDACAACAGAAMPSGAVGVLPGRRALVPTFVSCGQQRMCGICNVCGVCASCNAEQLRGVCRGAVRKQQRPVIAGRSKSSSCGSAISRWRAHCAGPSRRG